MKINITVLVFFAILGFAHAQSAGLQFDPDWEIPKAETEEFYWIEKLTSASQTQLTTSAMPRFWCYSELAFFCKLEVKMEKATRFPIKFRIGDVQYVDQLEGKRRRY